MKQQTSTYRLFTILTALLVVAGTVVPTGLFAMHHPADHCNLDQKADRSVSEMRHAPAEHAARQSNSAEKADCDIGLICECCSNNSTPKIHSANNFKRIKADLIVSNGDIIDRMRLSTASRSAFHLPLESDADKSSPPLFLKHGVFLN